MHSPSHPIHWQTYLRIILECLLSFILSSFCVAMYFTHPGGNFIPSGILLIGLFLFVIATCIYKLLKSLPIALLMLMIPLFPLVPLILILVFIPLIQKL